MSVDALAIIAGAVVALISVFLGAAFEHYTSGRLLKRQALREVCVQALMHAEYARLTVDRVTDHRFGVLDESGYKSLRSSLLPRPQVTASMALLADKPMADAWRELADRLDEFGFHIEQTDPWVGMGKASLPDNDEWVVGTRLAVEMFTREARKLR